MFTIKSDHRKKDILLEGIRLKENFHAPKSMKKSLGLEYHKIDICPKFCMFYYLENTKLIDCRICRHAHYKSKTGKERIIFTHKKLR
jgi:hypothetical protein